MTKLLWRKCRLCGVSEFKHVCPKRTARYAKYADRQRPKAEKQGMTDDEVRRVFGPIADVLRGRAP